MSDKAQAAFEALVRQAADMERLRFTHRPEAAIDMITAKARALRDALREEAEEKLRAEIDHARDVIRAHRAWREASVALEAVSTGEVAQEIAARVQGGGA